MTKEMEIDLFQRFLRKYSPKGDWEFQVSLPIFRQPTEMSAYTWTKLKDIIALRVDAIMKDRQGKYHIFEIKRRLGTHALGQLFIYKYFFCDQKRIDNNNVTMNVIYEDAQKGIEEAYNNYGVHLWKV